MTQKLADDDSPPESPREESPKAEVEKVDDTAAIEEEVKEGKAEVLEENEMIDVVQEDPKAVCDRMHEELQKKEELKQKKLNGAFNVYDEFISSRLSDTLAMLYLLLNVSLV